MKQTTDNEYLDVENLLPQIDTFFKSQEEYIRVLEMAVQLLQREVEHLRTQIKNRDKRSDSQKKSRAGSKLGQASSIFNTCSSEKKVLIKLHDILAAQFSIIESNLYFFTSDKKLVPVDDDEHSTLANRIRNLEEHGIIDWAVEKDTASVIPDLALEKAQLILVPLYLRGNPIGIYSAITAKDAAEFAQTELEYLTSTASHAAVAIDNIRSSEEISKMNRKLSLLNNQMIQSTKLASIGEIAASIAGELESPLKIMEGNINLIETGVGDKKRRAQIIKEQILKIKEITDRFAGLALPHTSEKSPSNINVCSLIDEVILFSGSQLLRDGIRIEKEYEDTDLKTVGYKSQLEQVILNLLLNARDSMSDGGIITLGVFKTSAKKLMITVADNSRGIDEKDLQNIFDPFYKGRSVSNRTGISLFLARNIIQQHNGSISVFSETGKGTTFKITLPLSV